MTRSDPTSIRRLPSGFDTGEPHFMKMRERVVWSQGGRQFVGVLRAHGIWRHYQPASARAADAGHHFNAALRRGPVRSLPPGRRVVGRGEAHRFDLVDLATQILKMCIAGRSKGL